MEVADNIPERAQKADLGGRSLSGRKRGHEAGDLKFIVSSQSQMVLLKPQDPRGISGGHSGRPGSTPTSVRYKESRSLEPVEDPAFVFSQ